MVMRQRSFLGSLDRVREQRMRPAKSSLEAIAVTGTGCPLAAGLLYEHSIFSENQRRRPSSSRAGLTCPDGMRSTYLSPPGFDFVFVDFAFVFACFLPMTVSFRDYGRLNPIRHQQFLWLSANS